MTPRGVLICCVLLAGIGLVIWQLSVTETHEAPAPARGGAPAVEPVATRPAVAVETAPVAISPKPFREVAQVEAPAGPATKSRTEGRKLKVMLVPEGIAAVGALVDFTPLGDGGQRGHATRSLVADSEGEVRLPKFRGNATVRGVLRDRCGTAYLTSGQLTEFTLELARGIAALVVDESDAPQAGVEVMLQEGDSWRPPEDRALTGSDGIARLKAPRRDEDERRRAGRQPRVAIVVPLDEPVEVALDPAKLPEDPVKLVLGKTGRVVVRLVAPGGQPFTGDATVEIRKPPAQTFRMNDGPDSARMPAVDGIATFPHVGLCSHLEIEVTPQDAALRKVQGSVKGPRQPGTTTVDLSCGALATTFRGRLLKGDGKPMARANMEIDFRTVDGKARGFSERGANTTTAADGRFEITFDVDPATVSPSGLTLVILKLIPIGSRGSMLEPGQKIALKPPDGLATGIAELGDIIAEELDLIASGMVVSGKGTPITQAAIAIAWHSERGWTKSPTDFELHGGTDGAGRFEIRGKLKGRGAMGLTAEREGWICLEPTPFTPGAKDVKIVMVRGGAIAGSFEGLGRSDSTVWTPSALQVSIVKSGSTISRVEAFMLDAIGDVDRHEVRVHDGKFTCDSLLPGSYSVEVHAGSDFRPNEPAPKPLMVIEGVIVEAGKTTRDPRLQNVDLTKLLESRVVTVVDETGRLLRDVRIGARASGSTGDYTSFATGSSGKAVVAMPADSVEIVATLKGYRTAVLQVTGDTTVTLEKTTPKLVTIKLAEGADLPAHPFSIAVRLDWVGEAAEKTPESSRFYDPRSRDRETVTFRTDRTATFEVDDAGVYAAQLYLYEEEAGNRRGRALDPDKKRTRVTVTESGATVTIPLDAESLRKATKKE
jgi:hypothetical protein